MMRNQQALVVFSFLLVAILASAGGVTAAPKYKIAYVVGQADELLNTSVTVDGIVLDVSFAEQPSRHKFEYTLQDEETGEQLRVHSWTGAPEENTYKTVTGTVKNVQNTPVLMVRSAIDFSDWRVWALAVLIVAAIVLLVMLLKPAPAETHVDPVIETEPPGDPGFPGPDEDEDSLFGGTMYCPSCHAEIPDDSRFCQFCRADLSGGGPPEDDDQFTVTIDEPKQDAAPRTVVIGSDNADLIVTESPAVQTGSRWVLTGENQKIGRDPSMDIRVADEGVSSEHAMIWWDMDSKSYMLQDNNSTNGTHVNGQRVANRTQLTDGDEIRFGKTKLRFRMNTESNKD